jgi:uncharacterized protein
MAFDAEGMRFFSFPQTQGDQGMRKVLLLIVLVVTGAPLFSQTIVAGKIQSQPKAAEETFAPDAPTHDQVMTLLDLLQVRRSMTVMMDGMKQAMKQGTEKAFRERVPDPSPEQLEALHGMIDDAIGEIPMDEMVEAVVPIYRQHLSKSDVEEMIRFYGGPVGQKLLREQPQMLQEAIRAGAAIQENRMDQIMIKVKERAQKLTEASEEKDNTPRK